MPYWRKRETRGVSRQAEGTVPNFPITARERETTRVSSDHEEHTPTIQYSYISSITHLPDTHQISVAILYRLSPVIPRDLAFQPQPK